MIRTEKFLVTETEIRLCGQQPRDGSYGATSPEVSAHERVRYSIDSGTAKQEQHNGSVRRHAAPERGGGRQRSGDTPEQADSGEAQIQQHPSKAGQTKHGAYPVGRSIPAVDRNQNEKEIVERETQDDAVLRILAKDAHREQWEEQTEGKIEAGENSRRHNCSGSGTRRMQNKSGGGLHVRAHASSQTGFPAGKDMDEEGELRSSRASGR